MSLAAREARFREFTSRFGCRRPSPLFAVHDADDKALEQLRIAASLYLSRCLPDRSTVSAALLADEAGLLAEMQRQWERIPNITPNGMVVPKRELNLEYNLVVSAFAALVASLGIDDLVDGWVNPPNLRVKEGLPFAQKLTRPYASERRHTEAWIALNTARCVSIFIPLLGDTVRNRVRFFAPPAIFREAWLRPLASYDEGARYAEQYEEVDLGYDVGRLYLADAATMHESARWSGAGARASIDVNFLLRPRAGSPGCGTRLLSQADLRSTGRTRLLLFTDSMNDQLDTRGGRLHPTGRRRLVDLSPGPRPASAPVRGLRTRGGSRIQAFRRG